MINTSTFKDVPSLNPDIQAKYQTLDIHHSNTTHLLRFEVWLWANYNDVSSRVVTLNGGLIRELPQNPRKIQV